MKGTVFFATKDRNENRTDQEFYRTVCSKLLNIFPTRGNDPMEESDPNYQKEFGGSKTGEVYFDFKEGHKKVFIVPLGKHIDVIQEEGNNLIFQLFISESPEMLPDLQKNWNYLEKSLSFIEGFQMMRFLDGDLEIEIST